MGKSRQSLREIIDEYRDALEHDSVPLSFRLMAAFFEFFPDPAWIKAVSATDQRTQMMHINRAYEEQLGVPATQYATQTDSDIWDPVTSALFAENDKLAVAEGKPIHIVEEVFHPVTGEKQRWVGWKWPIIVHGSVVAVCGCAVLDRE